MLTSLRHGTIVDGYDQQPEVDGGNSGEHVAHEAVMAGDVHEPERVSFTQILISEAEIDSEAALSLLGQSIGVHPGERAHEKCFSMIDVTGGSDQHREHRPYDSFNSGS